MRIFVMEFCLPAEAMSLAGQDPDVLRGVLPVLEAVGRD